MTLQVAIFEDENVLAAALCAHIEAWAETAGAAAQIEVLQSADELTEALARGCDILFFDIELGSTSGLAAAQQARAWNAVVPLVFTTNHCEYALQGYDAEPFRFLIKPVQAEDIAACMERAAQYHVGCREECLVLALRGGMRRIPTRDILYIEAQKHACAVITTRGEERFAISFSALLARLPEGMLQQCHRSYVVSCAHIRSMAGGVLTLSRGAQIPYSSTYASQILKKLTGMD